MSIRSSVEPSMAVQPARLAEQVFAAFCFVALFVLPPLFTEPFPLSAIPMFAVPTREMRFYTLTDRNGTVLSRDLYGLRSNVNFYLEHFYGVKYPDSLIEPVSREPEIPRLLENLRIRGRQNQAAFPLRLTMRVFGPVDDQTVGQIGSQSWLVHAEEND